MPSRRAVLATLAGVSTSALAGCANGDDPRTNGTNTAQSEGNRTTTTATAESTTATTTPPTERTLQFGETVELDGGTVKLHDPFRRHSALHLQGDSIVVADFEAQALFLRVAASGENAPSADSFSLAPGDHPHVRERFPRPGFRSLPQPYTGDGEGWVAFELPAPFAPETAPKVEIETESGTLSWALPDGVLAALDTKPPSFTRRAFDAPDSLSTGEESVVAVGIENTGGAATFRGGVEQAGVVYAPELLAFDVPAGETRRIEVPLGPFDGEGELRLTLVGHGIESVTRTVEVTGQ